MLPSLVPIYKVKILACWLLGGTPCVTPAKPAPALDRASHPLGVLASWPVPVGRWLELSAASMPLLWCWLCVPPVVFVDQGQRPPSRGCLQQSLAECAPHITRDKKISSSKQLTPVYFCQSPFQKRKSKHKV